MIVAEDKCKSRRMPAMIHSWLGLQHDFFGLSRRLSRAEACDRKQNTNKLDNKTRKMLSGTVSIKENCKISTPFALNVHLEVM